MQFCQLILGGVGDLMSNEMQTNSFIFIVTGSDLCRAILFDPGSKKIKKGAHQSCLHLNIVPSTSFVIFQIVKNKKYLQQTNLIYMNNSDEEGQNAAHILGHCLPQNIQCHKDIRIWHSHPFTQHQLCMCLCKIFNNPWKLKHFYLFYFNVVTRFVCQFSQLHCSALFI